MKNKKDTLPSSSTYTVSTITGGTIDFNTIHDALRYATQAGIVSGISFMWTDELYHRYIHITRKYKGIQKIKYRTNDFNYKDTVLFVWEL